MKESVVKWVYVVKKQSPYLFCSWYNLSAEWLPLLNFFQLFRLQFHMLSICFLTPFRVREGMFKFFPTYFLMIIWLKSLLVSIRVNSKHIASFVFSFEAGALNLQLWWKQQPLFNLFSISFQEQTFALTFRDMLYSVFNTSGYKQKYKSSKAQFDALLELYSTIQLLQMEMRVDETKGGTVNRRPQMTSIHKLYWLISCSGEKRNSPAEAEKSNKS